MSESFRTYAQELETVARVLHKELSRRSSTRTRRWARPDLWQEITLHCAEPHGYFISGVPVGDSRMLFVGGITDSECNLCWDRSTGRWWQRPCDHQLGLAALWIGHHPIPRAPADAEDDSYPFDVALAALIEAQ